MLTVGEVKTELGDRVFSVCNKLAPDPTPLPTAILTAPVCIAALMNMEELDMPVFVTTLP